MLFSTFGYDRNKVTRAMRSLSYDKLVIVTSDDNTRSEGYAQVLDISKLAETKVETLVVDKFDLLACFTTIVKDVNQHLKANHQVLINISGGTSLLACAAMLAAFQTGVEAYHVNDHVVQLPVLRNVSFEEMISKDQREALLNFIDGIGLGETKAECVSDMNRRKKINNYLALKKLGLLESRTDDEGTRLFLTPTGRSYRTFIRKAKDTRASDL